MIITIGLLFLLLSSLVFQCTPEMFRRVSILFVGAYFIFLLNGYSIIDSIYLWDGQIRMTNTVIWNELLTMVVVGFLFSIGVFSRIEIYMILLTGLVGIINMISSNDMLVTLLSLQLINVSFYLLLGTNKTSEAALSAAFKYLLLSAFTTTIFLAGVISLYAIYGTLNYDSLFIATSMNSTGTWVLLLVVGAVVFKLGAAPFHFWGPDVYDNSPTIFTAWLITLPKLALLSFLVSIFPLISEEVLAYFLGPVGFLSVIIGSLGLGAQERIKRLLAFSTISHMGFIMFALVTMDLNTFSFYYAIYLLTTVSLFGCLLALGPSTSMISQLSGMYLLNPALAAVFAISFFSLAGIPPLAGFFAKLYVLFSLVRFDLIFYALILVVTSTISTAYYLRIIKISFLDLPVIKETNLVVSANASIVISLVTCMLVLFMFKPSTIISLLTIVITINRGEYVLPSSLSRERIRYLAKLLQSNTENESENISLKIGN